MNNIEKLLKNKLRFVKTEMPKNNRVLSNNDNVYRNQM